MNLQTVIDDAKDRVDSFAAQGQKAANLSLKTFKQANSIVVEGVQDLLKSHTKTSKDLLASAKSGLEKARADGLKAVLAAPAGYLPPHAKLIDALKETRSTAVKTREDLVKLFKDGYASLSEDENVVVKQVKTTARKTGTAARKTANKATKAVKEAAAKVEAKV